MGRRKKERERRTELRKNDRGEERVTKKWREEERAGGRLGGRKDEREKAWKRSVSMGLGRSMLHEGARRFLVLCFNSRAIDEINYTHRDKSS